ncbi:nucleotide disphospho-sugar-binding domain-containing protein [Streptomyces sp. NPDC056431]|uniref:nucleotide disphospho-sugar-binding domain-containing protein n=1 Tax=unclassified Streptomyces TaxID=2593676 RepID=UPI0036ABDF8D
MRVLMIGTPVSSHLAPLVPLAWALRAAGHEVLVIGQPDIMGMAAAAGLNAVSVGERFEVEEVLRENLGEDERLIDTHAEPEPQVMEDYFALWFGHQSAKLPEYLEFARAFRPDLLVCDLLEYTAPVIGALLGVPVARHRWSVDFLTGFVRPQARVALLDTCRALGLDALPDPTIVLDPCPPSLQLPDAEPGTPIRAVPFNGNGQVPEWRRREWGTDRPRRRVAVSLGLRTLTLGGVPHVRRILQAFDGLDDTEAIATVEPEYREAIGPLPDHVRLIDPTPLHLLFGSCDAVVHHGGAGTTMTSIAHGLPQLVLPQLADMFATGERLAARGAAVTLAEAARQDDPEELHKALDRILSEPAHTAAARELRAEMEAMPSPARVVQDLERRVRDTRPV